MASSDSNRHLTISPCISLKQNELVIKYGHKQTRTPKQIKQLATQIVYGHFKQIHRRPFQKASNLKAEGTKIIQSIKQLSETKQTVQMSCETAASITLYASVS